MVNKPCTYLQQSLIIYKWPETKQKIKFISNIYINNYDLKLHIFVIIFNYILLLVLMKY